MDSDGLVMKIGEVSETLGVSQRTLRYYEELGLVAPRRSRGGIRLYSEADIGRIREILAKTEQGYSLGSISLEGDDKPHGAQSGAGPGTPETPREPAPPARSYKIGDIAKRLQTTVRTLRFYEEQGIASPARSQGGTRLYSSDDYAVFETAVTLARLGVELDTIRRLACGRNTCRSGDQSSRLMAGILGDLREMVTKKLALYVELERDIERADMLVRQCQGCENAPNKHDCPDCPMERHLDQSRLARLIWDRS